MTGPEHYREAERLLNEEPLSPEVAAQVHATLALAAATALTGYTDPILSATFDEAAWARVAGERGGQS